MNDLRFPTSLQIVLSLAVAHETNRKCTSMELATGLGANPAFVRTLLVPLTRAGIVRTSIGKYGGVELARDPDIITLHDIYIAVVEEKRLFSSRTNVPSVCVVSTNISTFFAGIIDEVETAMFTTLGKKTVAQSLTEIRQIDAARTVEKSNAVPT